MCQQICSTTKCTTSDLGRPPHTVTSIASCLASLRGRVDTKDVTTAGLGDGLGELELRISSPPDPWIWERLNTNGEVVELVDEDCCWLLLFT